MQAFFLHSASSGFCGAIYVFCVVRLVFCVEKNVFYGARYVVCVVRCVFYIVCLRDMCCVGSSCVPCVASYVFVARYVCFMFYIVLWSMLCRCVEFPLVSPW